MGNIQSIIDALQDAKVNEMGHVWITDSARNAMVRILMKEAELLKEPEAKQIDLYGNDEWCGLVCVCPDCNAEWMTDKANTHYCPNCGIRVKWE